MKMKKLTRRITLVIFMMALAIVWISTNGGTNGEALAGPEHKSHASSNFAKAADFTLKTLDGEEISLSDFKGKVVILDFWATWCPPCVKEIPHFNELAKEYKDAGLVVFGVSVDRDGAKAVNKFEKNKMTINYPLALFDQPTYDTYQMYLPKDRRGGIPFTFVIDREGNIREHYVGYRPKEEFVKAIKPLL
jgi:peroxiredoxin